MSRKDLRLLVLQTVNSMPVVVDRRGCATLEDSFDDDLWFDYPDRAELVFGLAIALRDCVGYMVDEGVFDSFWSGRDVTVQGLVEYISKEVI